jgi:hypothetical protein
MQRWAFVTALLPHAAALAAPLLLKPHLMYRRPLSCPMHIGASNKILHVAIDTVCSSNYVFAVPAVAAAMNTLPLLLQRDICCSCCCSCCHEAAAPAAAVVDLLL